MKVITESNRHITVREIAKLLNGSHTRIENHIRRLGFVKKLDIFVPHELKEIHPTQRINICDTHFKRNGIDLSIANRTNYHWRRKMNRLQ